MVEREVQVLTTGGMRPTGINNFTGSVFDVLEKHILSPWNVLKVECGWRGVDPLHMDPAVLESLLPGIRKHVARITDDENAADCEAGLRALLGALHQTPRPPVEAIEFDI
jgi:hypothetical protein